MVPWEIFFSIGVFDDCLGIFAMISWTNYHNCYLLAVNCKLLNNKDIDKQIADFLLILVMNH